ncbi:MAG: hypothetical protein ABIK64_05875 [Bacillota bacterium]
MVWFICIAALTVLSFGLQYFLSYRKNAWHGLILPVVYGCAAGVFLLLNLLSAFPETEAFGSFLTEFGSAGFIALILKIGFVCSPAAVHLILYFVRRHRYNKTHCPVKHNREYKKMLADDLE